MTAGECIVCETTGRWAAALRVAITRGRGALHNHLRLHEVRSLDELEARLGIRPHSLALVEVRPGTLGDLLEWLSQAVESHRRARFVALLDSEFRHRDEREVADALIEAGAVEIAASPRRLHHVLLLARQHAALAVCGAGLREEQSLTQWAWDSLPWQDA